MLALVSKYAIDAKIGGQFKPTYLECEPDALEDLDSPEELKTLTLLYHQLTVRAGRMWNTGKWVDHDRPCIGLRQRKFIMPLVRTYERRLCGTKLPVC